ncbi:MAG: FGGY-family carbohydrate kinase [Deinococcales bacterium]
MSELLLGLDIGTTLTKGVLTDLHGGIVAEAEREATLYSEEPTWAEEDPEQWWENSCAVTRALLERAGARGGDVAAVGVSGMVPAMVLLDGEGVPLRRSIQQNDARTGTEILELKQGYDEDRFFRLTGGSINQQVVAPKARWLRKHEPHTLDRLSTLLGSYDYINFRLTGVRGVERNWALESGLYDLRQGRFSDELLELAGLVRHQLPDVHDAHDVIGVVHPVAAEATGLASGTPVVGGAADHVASAFATTAYADGDLVIKFGGAGDILLSLDGLVTDRRLFIDHHLVPGKFYLNGCMATSGSLVKWYLQQFCAEESERARREGRSAYELLDELAAGLDAGSDGLVLLPYFLGEKTPLHDPAARGTLLGLDLHHTRHHLYRAALESVAYGFRHHVDVLAELGLPIRRVLAADGGARSDLWLQIAADVLKMPVQRVAHHPGSSLGAAIAAGIGSGRLDDWSAVERYVHLDRRFLPDERASARYDRLYGVYRDTYTRLRDLYPRLAR